MNRSISADLIKSLSIFGVVYIHGSFLLSGNSDFQAYSSYLFRFCVPCFIIIWAYLLEKSYQKKEQKQRKSYILEKFVHLFTVFLIWSLIYFVILADWTSLNFKKIVTTHFAGYGWSGQYFFIILFQLLLLFPILRKVDKYKFIFYPVVILLCLLYIYYGYFSDSIPNVVKKLGDRPFIFWIPYVYIGTALAKEKLRKIKLSNSFFILLIPIESICIDYFTQDHFGYLTPVVLLSSILFTVAILQSPIKFKSERINNLITFIGKNTLTIFVSNPLVIIVLKLIIPQPIFPNLLAAQIILPFISSFIILGICMLISILINKSKLNGILN
jgi:hypothetical protein